MRAHARCLISRGYGDEFITPYAHELVREVRLRAQLLHTYSTISNQQTTVTLGFIP